MTDDPARTDATSVTGTSPTATTVWPPVGGRVRVLRRVFRTVGAVAPGLAARWADALFCTPPRPEARPREEAFIASGRRFAVQGAGETLAAWEWGTGPTVVLAHGWGSRAGRFATLAPALVAAGFRVITYDGPAHGASSGRRASLVAFTEALRDVVRHLGPVHAAVGHSLGGAAIALALADGLPIGRAALLAPPADPSTFSYRFAAHLAIPPRVHQRMRRRIERRLNVTWDGIRIPGRVGALAVPALIVHCRDDAEVLLADAEAISAAWPGAELVTVSGLGHRAIVRDPEVVRRVVAFVAG